ncbi:MAG: hypothetical protein QXU45_05265 [Candidatus Bathyarchaeia archaeon]
MTAKKNKSGKKRGRKIDLLEIPEPERNNLIEKLRQNLRQNIAETKMWNRLLQCETLTINGQVVFSDEESFDGLSI